jgi:hypothetical protein
MSNNKMLNTEAQINQDLIEGDSNIDRMDLLCDDVASFLQHHTNIDDAHVAPNISFNELFGYHDTV